MELRWSEEQLELAEMLGTLLARHSDSGAVRKAVKAPRGYDERLWSTLCEQVGVAALTVPEEYAGAGYGFAEAAIVLEQLGRALTPSPVLSQVLVTETLLGSGDAEACARVLPGIAAGETVAALVWSGTTSWPSAEEPGTGEPGAGEPVAELGGRLSGVVENVLDGDTADVLLVVASTADGPGLFEVAAGATGLSREHTPAMDQTLRLARVSFDGVEATRVGGDLRDVLRRVHAVGAAAVASLQVGVAQRGLDMTVSYSKERVQFGRQIGSFQALKHRMADMLVQVETARSAAMDAAFAVATDSPDLLRRTSVAKAWCSEAVSAVAAETIQLHGGIAITWEHDAHLVFKRAHSLGLLFGPAHLHRATLV